MEGIKFVTRDLLEALKYFQFFLILKKKTEFLCFRIKIKNKYFRITIYRYYNPLKKKEKNFVIQIYKRYLCFLNQLSKELLLIQIIL